MPTFSFATYSPLKVVSLVRGFKDSSQESQVIESILPLLPSVGGLGLPQYGIPRERLYEGGGMGIVWQDFCHLIFSYELQTLRQLYSVNLILVYLLMGGDVSRPLVPIRLHSKKTKS